MATSENQCHRLAGRNYVVEADYSLFAGCSRLGDADFPLVPVNHAISAYLSLVDMQKVP